MTQQPDSIESTEAGGDASGGRPIIVLVEWQASEMGLEAAELMARDALAVLRDVPGLDEARVFGDFDSGVHCFQLTWRNREAMDRYMASDVMHAVRGAAMPFVAGKPERRIFVDYGAASARAEAPSGQR